MLFLESLSGKKLPQQREKTLFVAAKEQKSVKNSQRLIRQILVIMLKYAQAETETSFDLNTPFIQADLDKNYKRLPTFDIKPEKPQPTFFRLLLKTHNKNYIVREPKNTFPELLAKEPLSIEEQNKENLKIRAIYNKVCDDVIIMLFYTKVNDLEKVKKAIEVAITPLIDKMVAEGIDVFQSRPLEIIAKFFSEYKTERYAENKARLVRNFETVASKWPGFLYSHLIYLLFLFSEINLKIPKEHKNDFPTISAFASIKNECFGYCPDKEEIRKALVKTGFPESFATKLAEAYTNNKNVNQAVSKNLS